MDQIIQNLSFETVTVPQDVKPTSTSYTAPIKVKIKMKKLDNTGQGVVCVPKMKVSRTDKTRVVHSDETIMSFNVHMKPEGEAKRRRKSQNKFFHLLKTGKCVDIQSEEDDEPPYMLASSVKLNQGTANQSILRLNSQNQRITPTDTKNNIKTMKEIAKPPPIFFGKCKPGGCLDPPFGEDDYQYQSAVPPKKDFKGRYANKKQPAYGEIQTEEADQTKKSKTSANKNNCEEKDASTTLMLYKANSGRNLLNQQYSDSIITYPTRTSSGDISALEKNISSRKSSAVKKDQLSTGTYFSPNKKRNSQEIKKELTNRNTVLKNSQQKEELKVNLRSSTIIHSETMKLNTIFRDSPSKIEEKNISKILQETVPQPDYELLELVEGSGNILLSISHINEPIASFDNKPDQLKKKSGSKMKHKVRENFDIDSLNSENIESKSVNVMDREKSILRIGQDITDEPFKLNSFAITSEYTNASPENVFDENTADNNKVQSYEELKEPTTNILVQEQQRKDIRIPTNYKNIISSGKQLLNTHDVQNNLSIEIPANYVDNTKESYSKTSSKINEIPSLEANLMSEKFTNIGKSDFKKPSDQFIERKSDLVDGADKDLLNDNNMYEIYKDFTEYPTEDNKYIDTTHSDRTKDKLLEKKSSLFSISSRKRRLTDFISKETPEIKKGIDDNQNNSKLEISIHRDNLSKHGSFSCNLPLNIPIDTGSDVTNKKAKSEINNYILKGDSRFSNAPPDFPFNTVNTSADNENKEYENDTASIAPKEINKYYDINLKNNDIITTKNVPEVIDTTSRGQQLKSEIEPSHENISYNIMSENSNLSGIEYPVFKTISSNDFNALSGMNEININNLLRNDTIIITNSDVKNYKPDTNQIQKYIKNENSSGEIFDVTVSPSKNDKPYLSQHKILNTSFFIDPQRESEHVVQKNRQLEGSESDAVVNESLKDIIVNKKQISSVKSLSRLEIESNNILDENINMSKKPSLMETESYIKSIENLDNPHHTRENSIAHSNQLNLDLSLNKLKLLTIMPENTNTNLSVDSSSIINNIKTTERWKTEQTMANIHNDNKSNDIKGVHVNNQIIKEIEVNNDIKNVELKNIEIVSNASSHQDTERNIKVDLGFQTYVNENAAIIIKTFDASQEPERFSEDKVFIIRSALNLNDNQLLFAINSDTTLSIKIESNKNMNDSEGRSFKPKENYGADKTQNIYKNSTIHINAIDAGVLQETLSEFYENELVPIENLIKSLRVEIDRITKYRQIRKKSFTATKKYKPIYYKKCTCTRK